eukprot:COSAG01_NODE_67530_length_266_cov_5.011976_1_plen_40_part_10
MYVYVCCMYVVCMLYVVCCMYVVCMLSSKMYVCMYVQHLP